MSHVQMTPILASTRSVFFQQYNFDFDPLATLYGEFRRMAKGRKWRQGSNSKKYEEGWHQCFGPDIPVGYNIDKRAFPAGAHIATDDAMSSLLRSVQSLHLERRSNGNARAQRANVDFTSYHGSDADITEKWQTLCQDCGIDPVPRSIKQCKKALKGKNINIFHFLKAKKAGRIPYHFHSKKELTVFMDNHPEKRYPLDMAKQNRFLSVLLIECW